MNKETLQNYNNRLNENNNTIDNINSLLKRLPTGSEDLTEELTGYNTELTEQEDLVGVIAKALEGKASGGGSGGGSDGGSDGGSSLNLFVQPGEPATKEGVWLQTDEELSDKITVTTQSYVNETTLGTYKKAEYVPTVSILSTAAVLVGDWIYSFGSTTFGNYKFNVVTGEQIQLASCPDGHNNTSTAAAVGNYIYVFGGIGANTGKNAYKYDITNDTITKVADVPTHVYYGASVAIGEYIYIVCGDSYNSAKGSWSPGRTMYKYDTVNDTYENIPSTPMYFENNSIIAVGSDIYFVLGWATNSSSSGNYDRSIYKYDTTTNTKTLVGTLDTGGINWSYTNNRSILIGDEIFILDYNTTAYGYIFNIRTGESRRDSNFDKPSTNSAYLLLHHKDTNQIFFSATGTYLYANTYSQRFDYTGDEDTILMRQRNGSNPYQTVLTPATNVENRLLTSFEDVGYYSTETGINNDIPTYYGTGTEWVKFKG